MEFLLFLVIWLVLCFAVAQFAENKGLDRGAYFLGALVLSPLIGALLVAVSPGNPEKVAAARGMKKCPDCAELVQGDARICRFCQHAFSTTTAGTVPPAAAPAVWPAAQEEREARPVLAEPSRRGWSTGAQLMLITLVLGALGLVLFMSLPPGTRSAIFESHAERDEKLAALTMRTVVTASETYRSIYGQYPPSLAALGPATAATVGKDRADLIDEVLAGGRSGGYVYEYTPTRRGRRITGFQVVARPAQQGAARRRFFGDETGILRVATGTDPRPSSPPI